MTDTAAIRPVVQSSSDHIYAAPRPLMRDGYLVRSNKAVTFLRAVDALLRVCVRTTSRATPSAEPKRILIANWAHLGDVITSLPTLRAIRLNFPSALIDLLVGSGSRVVLENSGLYDNLYEVDHFVLNRSGKGLIAKLLIYLNGKRKFLAAARSKKYDLAIDLYQYFPPASPLFWQAGASVRCGFTSGGFGPLLTHPVRWSFQDKPIGQYGQDLIAELWPELGKSIGRLDPFYPYDPHRIIHSPSVRPEGSYVIVHMGVGQTWREWPEKNWCDLIQIWGIYAPLLVFCGTGAREEERARRVARCSSNGNVMLCFGLSWPEFVALMAGAAGLVCLRVLGSSSSGNILELRP